jgi:hypothetical protein
MYGTVGPHLVSLNGGPCPGRHIVPRACSSFYLKLSTGKWAYYFTVDDLNGLEKYDKSSKTRKDKKPQAIYKFGREVDEDYEYLQVFITAYLRDYNIDARTEFVASVTKV